MPDSTPTGGNGAALPLEAAIATIDGWLEARADSLDPFRWTEPEEVLLRRKAFCEIGLLMYVRSGWGEVLEDGGLYAFVADGVADPRFAGLVNRDPRRLLLYGGAILFARRAGVLLPSVDHAVRRVLKARATVSTERLPHRALELWHFSRVYGVGTTPAVSRNAAVALGCVGNPLDPLRSSTDDAYAFTHSVFYLTDFGSPSAGFEDPAALFEPYAGGLLDALALRFIGAANMDVALELLLAGCVLGTLSRQVADLIVRWAVGVVEERGVVTAPPAAVTEAFVRSRPEEAEWARSYHTVCVASMALRAFKEALPHLPDRMWVSDRSLVQLAAGLAALADYDLERGADLIAPLASQGDLEGYEPVLDQVARFVRDQEREDGHFGWFPDERAMYARRYPEGSFDEDIQRGLDQACRSLLGSLLG